MKEIKIYLDKERKKEVKDNIEFERVVAGKTTLRKIYILNTTKYYLNIELKLKGKYIEISKTIEKISPKQIKEVEFKLTPKVTLMKPITAQLKIKISYVIE